MGVSIFFVPAAICSNLFWLRNAFHRKHKQRLNHLYNSVKVSVDWLTLLRFVQPVFVGLAICLILVSLARPQVISERRDQYSEGIDIMLLLDISDSMMEKDLNPNRLEAAKRVARQFIKGRLQDRIGLIIFAGEPYRFARLLRIMSCFTAFWMKSTLQ
jgi:Ca-activated chloride channel family protein